MNKAIVYIVYLNIPMAMTATSALLPGVFYWRPRLGVFSNYIQGKKEETRKIYQPTKSNIIGEYVVLIDGYSLGLTVIALSAAYQAATKPFLHLHPLHASYYTNVYRWGLRHASLIPPWIGATGSGKYIDTHKVWRRRFYYMDELVPKFLRHLFPWVSEKDWKEEETFLKNYNKYSEPAFGKHYRYPTKVFRNFNSQITEETMENMDGAFNWEA